MKRIQQHYYILLDGDYVGQQWARSEEEACSRYWWKNVKDGDKYSYRFMDPSDFEAISHTA